MHVALRGRRGWLVAPALVCSLLVACGDDDGGQETGDSSVVDGGVDASNPSMDASLDSTLPDASKPFTPRILRAEISVSGNDVLYGVTFDSAGNIFAVGSTVSGASSDSSFAVAKYTPAGILDLSFGSNGYATLNVTQGGVGQELARAIVLQGDKLVVVGQAESKAYAADAGVGVLANDTDVVVVRFNANGTIDTTFGTAGIARFDVGTGWVRPAETFPDGGSRAASLQASDAPWSLGQTADGKLVIHTQTAGLEADGGFRTDSDFALLRLTADGALDASFGGTGVVRTDFNRTSASVRSATALANGSIVGAGYSTNSVLGTESQNPVLYKVNADGSPDTSFAIDDQVSAPGVWHGYARPDQKRCEAYGATPQGDKFVTLGYGPTPGNTFGTDWVWFRFNANGSQDKSFGTNGATFQDLGSYGDNGRALLTLPDNRVIGVGSGRPKPAVAPEAGKEGQLPQDALIGVITADGQQDLSFGPGGLQNIDLGGGMSDELTSVAISPDQKQIVAVGKGHKTSAQDDDDGVVVIFPTP